MPSVSEDPGDQRPGPHEARPDRIDAAADQRRRREGEDDREADIAEIKQRRMDGEAGVLQDRIEIVAFHGGWIDAREGIGRQQDEEQKGRADPGPARPAHRRANRPAWRARSIATGAPKSDSTSTHRSIEPS